MGESNSIATSDMPKGESPYFNSRWSEVAREDTDSLQSNTLQTQDDRRSQPEGGSCYCLIYDPHP
jgi:hypothetical protein